jgi:hypothetical protein
VFLLDSFLKNLIAQSESLAKGAFILMALKVFRIMEDDVIGLTF